MRQSKVKIAVTGGIGSGKSTVCSIIGGLGYPVYSCDEAYKIVLQEGNTVELLAAEFGDDIVNADKSLNRAKLAQIVFSDNDKLNKLNKLTHPKIFEKIFSLSKDKEGFVFYEVPVLFEGGYQNMFDDVLVILRDKNERIESVGIRDGLKAEEVENRLNKQFSYHNSDFSKYYVIHNNEKIVDLYTKIDEYINFLKKKYLL